MEAILGVMTAHEGLPVAELVVARPPSVHTLVAESPLARETANGATGATVPRLIASPGSLLLPLHGAILPAE